jgi:phytoene dehydrogenase-like protein
VLLEQSERLGGRAATQQERSYLLNFGPHALFRGGVAARTLRHWSIPVLGCPPNVNSDAFLVRDGRKYPFIFSAGRLLTSRLFSAAEKVQAMRVLGQLAKGGTTEGQTMQEWIEQRTRAPRVRELASMLMRVGTYSADLSLLSADAALRQFRSASSHGVLYLHGGWQTLVAGLERRARWLGVEIRQGEAVETLQSIAADGIVLAVPPAAVERISGRRLPAMHPVRAACLDLALRALPEGSARVAFCLDQPLYLSVHSAVARLAPAGGAVVHLCKYLAGPTDAASDRAELERYADFAIPGWREQADLVRFLPHMTVTHAAFSPQGRPAVDALGIPGVALAGDWVGGQGMLADAAVASGLAAAAMVQQRRLRAA